MVRHKKPEQTNTGMHMIPDLTIEEYVRINYNNQDIISFSDKNEENDEMMKQHTVFPALNFQNSFTDYPHKKNNLYDSIEEEKSSFNDISCCSGDSYQQNEGDFYLDLCEEEISHLKIENNDDQSYCSEYNYDSIEDEASNISFVDLNNNNMSFNIEENDQIPEKILSENFLEETKPKELISLQQIEKIETSTEEYQSDEELYDLLSNLKELDISTTVIKKDSGLNPQTQLHQEEENNNIKLGKFDFFNSKNDHQEFNNNLSLKRVKNSPLSSSNWTHQKMVEPYRHLKDHHYKKWKQR